VDELYGMQTKPEFISYWDSLWLSASAREACLHFAHCSSAVRDASSSSSLPLTELSKSPERAALQSKGAHKHGQIQRMLVM